MLWSLLTIFTKQFGFNGSRDNDPFTPPKWLSTWLPAAIILSSLLFDLLSSIRYPKISRTLWNWTTSPFRNFLTVDDLLESFERTPEFSTIKNRYLIGLSSVALVGWVGCLVFGISVNDGEYATKALVYSISWVSLPCSYSRFVLV